MTLEDHPFLHVTDSSKLSPEEHKRYQEFFFSRTPGERSGEVMRLNRAKWGAEVFDRAMDKSKMEMVDLKTGEVLHVFHNPEN